MTTRRTVSRWGEHGPRPTSLRQNEAIFARFAVSISLEVTCSAAAAYALITDITRIGEFSPECIGATWLDGATAPRVGARFEGTNLRVAEGAEHVWIRPCTITVATPRCPRTAVGSRRRSSTDLTGSAASVTGPTGTRTMPRASWPREPPTCGRAWTRHSTRCSASWSVEASRHSPHRVP